MAHQRYEDVGASLQRCETELFEFHCVLIDAAGFLPGEQVHVLNLSNAERLITYVIEAPAGSGTMMLNGPAARLGAVGDKVIVISYCVMSDEEARKLKPTVVLVDEKNRIAR